jgi:hypothetical protein
MKIIRVVTSCGSLHNTIGADLDIDFDYKNLALDDLKKLELIQPSDVMILAQEKGIENVTIKDCTKALDGNRPGEIGIRNTLIALSNQKHPDEDHTYLRHPEVDGVWIDKKYRTLYARGIMISQFLIATKTHYFFKDRIPTTLDQELKSMMYAHYGLLTGKLKNYALDNLSCIKQR